jgi:hypothetical protein
MFRTMALALAVSGLCPCSTLRADAAEDKAVAFVKELGGKVSLTSRHRIELPHLPKESIQHLRHTRPTWHRRFVPVFTR